MISGQGSSLFLCVKIDSDIRARVFRNFPHLPLEVEGLGSFEIILTCPILILILRLVAWNRP